eukprot:TRINITY_DN8254_c0_g1_i1.p1 TRINITY_DN8254_c0_g1~~TRINITY_DN8254_c0_g1_i1.p1  ORF type:complete len:483 (+),score=77.18 TRINITY_DN8254_c0_g1_i1:51-1451(+)
MDDLFAYRTPRTVMIRDRKLGITRVLLLIILFVYVVIYEVILQKGYLVKEFPVGYARTSLQQRQAEGTIAPYCCSYEGCEEAAFGSTRGRLPCVAWDNHNSVVPPAEEFSSFLTTRVKISKYSPVEYRCLVNATVSGQAPCPSWDRTDLVTYYVTGPEEATLLIRHAVYGNKNDLVITSTNMPKARLANSDRKYIKNFCDLNNTGDMDITCSGSNPALDRVGDIVTISELLGAADIKQDEATLTNLDKYSSAKSQDTMRYDGVVLLIVVDYAGTGFQQNNVKYTYRVKHVPGAEYKYEEVKDIHYTDPTTSVTMVRREVWDRHGIRILVVPAGWMGKFSFLEMMKTLVTGLALLAIAGTITDYVVMRLLPDAQIYRRYKNVKTVDFSDLDPKNRRKLKSDRKLTWGNGYLTDEVFVYGELSDEEKEVSDKTRSDAEGNKNGSPEAIQTNPLESNWDDRAPAKKYYK